MNLTWPSVLKRCDNFTENRIFSFLVLIDCSETSNTLLARLTYSTSESTVDYSLCNGNRTSICNIFKGNWHVQTDNRNLTCTIVQGPPLKSPYCHLWKSRFASKYCLQSLLVRIEIELTSHQLPVLIQFFHSPIESKSSLWIGFFMNSWIVSFRIVQCSRCVVYRWLACIRHFMQQNSTYPVVWCITV